MAASGSWQSRCGKATYAEIKLWDTAIGSEVKRLLDSQQLSVPATVRPCRSQMQGVFGADRDGYANHCPRCKAMFGQVFLDGELQRATSRGLRPIMTTDLRLTTRAITHSNWEYLHFCAACA